MQGVENGSGSSHYCPWSRGFSFKARKASTRWHNNEWIELEVETAIWPLWAAQARESTGWESSTVLAAVTDPGYQGKLRVKKILFEIQIP